MDYQALAHYLQPLQPAMVEALGELVQYESPSDDKLRLDALARRLAERFRLAGADVAVLPSATAGDHVRGIFTPRWPSAAARPALLLCHFDTVWPVGTLAARPFRVEGGQAWGPGSFDMKGGIVLAEFALRAIGALEWDLPRPAIVLLTSDEEQGSSSSRALIEEHARQAEYVLVLESPLGSGALKTARKGVGGFSVEIEGRAAHAGVEPEKGISAIHELAQQILYLYSLGDPERGTTLSVGVVHGGTRSNVVAAHADAHVDARVWTRAEAERIEAAILSLKPFAPGAVVRARGGFERPPLERTPQIAELFQRVRQVGLQLGLDLAEGSTGGGSDGNFTAALGIPTLDGMGAQGDGAHADHEHVLIDSLPIRAALLAAALMEL